MLPPHESHIASERGEHIHHGYWPTDASKATESKEVAQHNLIRLLLDISSTTPAPQDGTPAAPTGPTNLRILDVGCGVGGTTRCLASTLGATVTGITISSKQVQLATRLSKAASQSSSPGNAPPDDDTDTDTDTGHASEFIPLGPHGGKVRFIELDAETMGAYFAAAGGAFDMVWITEALSHFPNKALFFHNARQLLRGGGKLVVADLSLIHI